MSSVSKSVIAILTLVALGSIAALILLRPARPLHPAKIAAPAPAVTSPANSLLAQPPDWTSLAPYQDSIARAEFERLLTTVFTTGNAWRTFIQIDDGEARIATGNPPPTDIFHLRFSPPGISPRPPSRHWRTADELPPAPPGKPLDGLKIAIDPGHIGGEWAKMEERWFVNGGGTPVQEGDITLRVANLLKPRLEALGAQVSLVRKSLEPVTPVRPAQLEELASGEDPAGTPAAQFKKDAERLFYRTAEIRARADVVNRTLKPDLVLCLHFNAEAWGDPNQPVLIDHTHLHLLVNGAYTDDEVQLVDQRFAMLRKLLQRTHREEVLVGATVAGVFAKASGLQPYLYPPESKSVLPIAGQPYLWARNLLANRLYDCPVIFMEPYVMNSVIDYARIQAGDYEGLREISGKAQPSIFREYADSVASGLAEHYAARRGK